MILKIASYLIVEMIAQAHNSGHYHFKQITRSKTINDILTNQQIKSIGLQLLEAIPDIEKGIRLIGLQTSNFEQSTKDVFLEQLEFEF